MGKDKGHRRGLDIGTNLIRFHDIRSGIAYSTIIDGPKSGGMERQLLSVHDHFLRF